MERDQILKVMVPVGVFALLLILVGVVIALNSGGGTIPSGADIKAGAVDPGPPSGGGNILGSVALDDSGMTRDLPSLTAPEWKDAGRTEVPGLKMWDVVEGTEDITAITADAVKVHYIGWRTDGFSFDSSFKGGQPVQFSLSGVIKGWTFGIPGMKVGGIRRLYIPSKFAYGQQGQGRDIPPNADLVFEVKLLRVIRP